MLYKKRNFLYSRSLCISFFQLSNHLEQIKISFWNPFDLSRYFLLISPSLCVRMWLFFTFFPFRLSQLLASSPPLLTALLSLSVSLYLASCSRLASPKRYISINLPFLSLKGKQSSSIALFTALPTGTSSPSLPPSALLCSPSFSH